MHDGYGYKCIFDLPGWMHQMKQRPIGKGEGEGLNSKQVISYTKGGGINFGHDETSNWCGQEEPSNQGYGEGKYFNEPAGEEEDGTGSGYLID